MSFQNTKGLILFGADLRQETKASADLEALGLKLIKLAPSDVNWTVANDAQQYRYGLYRSNLPAFLKALDGKHTSLLWTFKSFTPMGELSGFELPPVILNFEGRMSDDVRDNSIISSFPHADIREVVKSAGRGDKYAYVISKLPLDAGKTLAELPGVNHITPQFDNTICIKSIPYYRLALRIATKFLLLHNYPSFADKDHYEQFDKDRLSQPNWKDEDEGADMDVEDESRARKAHGGRPYRDGEMGTFGDWAHRSSRGGATAPPQTKADKPTIEVTEIDIGGYFASYVPALSLPDTHTVPSIIKDFFYGCLAEDEEEAAEIYNDLQAEFGAIGKTDEGKALAHLYLCIKLAIVGQLSIKAYVSKSGYAGCVMRGYGTNITIEGRTIGYADTSELKACIQKADVHTRALAGIKALLDPEAQESFDTDVTSMATLRKKLSSSGITEAQRVSITNLAHSLQFRIPVWRVNGSTLATFFKLLNEAGPLPDDLPIHSSALFSDDRLFVLLSCFGDFAPTFRVPGGREVPLDTFQAVVFDSKSNTKKTQAVTRVGCRTVPLATAHLDWQTIKTTKTILNPFMMPKAKVSMEHFTRFFDGSAMNDILSGLRKFTSTGAVTAGGPSGKRKEGPEGVVDSDRARKRKAVLDF